MLGGVGEGERGREKRGKGDEFVFTVWQGLAELI
jgi:hypothetical protein